MEGTAESLEQCLAVIKRFLLCPVCLDDFQNPAITPCAHTFCKFCIYEHIGKKRQASCPLCMKTFTRRSLKHSGKLNEITIACRELLTTYEAESGSILRPSSVPDEFLHLSQELTQHPTISNLVRAQSIHSGSNSTRPKSLMCANADGKITARTSKILLGTAARVRRSQQKKDDVDDSLLLTQPMILDSEGTSTICQGRAISSSNSAEDLMELFASTQLTQPMMDNSEFTPVMGMRESTGVKESHIEKTNALERAHVSNLTAAGNSRHKGIRTVPSRPPVPPRAQLNTRNTKESVDSLQGGTSTASKRSFEPSSFVRPRKQTRRESSHSTLSSAHGVLTKTHEVFCQINVTDKQGSDTLSAAEVHSLCGTRLKRLPSGTSISSWPLKRSRLQMTLTTRNKLLRKYNLTRQSLSFKKSMKDRPALSPGWSRWRAMCHGLKHKGSSLSLNFRADRKSKVPTVITPNHSFLHTTTKRSMTNISKSTNSGSFLHRISDTVLRRSKRDRNKREVTKSLVPETQDLHDELNNLPNTCFINETPISPERALINSRNPLSNPKQPPCQFIVPLKRLLPKATENHFSIRRDSHHCSLTSALQLPPPMPAREVNSLNPLKSPSDKPPSSCNENDTICHTITPNYRMLHCSSCGESLVVHPNGLSTPYGSPSRTAIRTAPSITADDLSCSISSTYWQAEDPCDSAFSGLHTDHLVSLNRTAAASVSLFSDVGCQTSLDFLGIPEIKKPEMSTTLEPNVGSEELLKSHIGDGSLQLNKNSSISSTVQIPQFSGRDLTPVAPLSQSQKQQESLECTSLPRTHAPVPYRRTKSKGNSIEPSESSAANSTFPTCSMDVIPTVDRERLRNECNELEAVVAALQQQLEAQAAQLSPNATEELLRTAGTEPCEEEMEMYSRIVDPVGKSQKSKTGDHSSDSDTNAITETSSHEPVIVIPSSQVDDELDTVEKLSEDKENVSLENMPVHSSATTITRVEASQPPSSFGAVTGSLIPTPLVPSKSHTACKPTHMEPTLPRTDLTECPETDLDGLSNRPDDALSVSQHPQCSRFSPSSLKVTGSNLTGNGLALLRRFCKVFGATENSRFIPKQTTHVVMREEPNRPRVVKRTLKYFVGILNRAWIVNTQWLHDSIEAGIILDETPYEIEGDTVCGDRHEGPRRGRLNVPAQPQRSTGSLPDQTVDGPQGPFAGLWLCAFGSLGLLSLSDFMTLALDGGASRVFEKPEYLTTAVESYLKSECAKNTGVRRPRAMILTDQNPPDFDASKCLALYQTHGIPVISIDWMLNCISLYRRIPISPLYRICPSPVHNPPAPLTAHNAHR